MPPRIPDNAGPENSHHKASTGFCGLAHELQLMILEEIITDYTTEKHLDALLRDALARVAPLALINKKWRDMIQSKIYGTINIKAERLPALVYQMKANPRLLSYLKELRVTFITGYSKDDEATANLPSGGLVSAVVKTPRFTISDREMNLERTVNNITKLLSLATPREGLGLKRLTLSAGDAHLGRYNGEGMPQFRMISPGSALKPLSSNLQLRELVLETEILENLELAPDTVQEILGMHKDLEVLELKMSDIRAYRQFRRKIYNGLVKTVQGITTSHQNLTTLKLHYPGSTGELNDDASAYSGVHALANKPTKADPLMIALCTLSRRLVKFHFVGRISTALFASTKAWPRLKDYYVEFDPVDSFGDVIMYSEAYYYDYKFPCLDCGDANREDACETDDKARQAISCVASEYESRLDDPEGYDLLRCEACVKDPGLLGRMTFGGDGDFNVRREELFLAASKAMMKMPEIEKWEIRSNCRNVTFAFSRSRNTVQTQQYWKPAPEAQEIWNTRFPDLIMEVIEHVVPE